MEITREQVEKARQKYLKAKRGRNGHDGYGVHYISRWLDYIHLFNELRSNRIQEMKEKYNLTK